MTIMLQLKYDELRAIAKQFRDCGEDITLLFTKTRDRTMDLRTMWKGDAADKFFEEMELELLPPLKQTGVALFAMQDVLLQVIKYVYEADQDTAKFFKQDVGFLGSFAGGGVGGEVFDGIGGIRPGMQHHVGAVDFAGQQGTEAAQGGSEESGAVDTTGQNASGGGKPASPVSASTQQVGAVTGGGAGMGSGGVRQGSVGGAGSYTSGGSNNAHFGDPIISEPVVINSPLKPDHIYESSNTDGMAQGASQQSTTSDVSESETKETGAQVGATAAAAASGVGVAAMGKVGLRSGRKFSKKRRINR